MEGHGQWGIHQYERYFGSFMSPMWLKCFCGELLMTFFPPDSIFLERVFSGINFAPYVNKRRKRRNIYCGTVKRHVMYGVVDRLYGKREVVGLESSIRCSRRW